MSADPLIGVKDRHRATVVEAWSRVLGVPYFYDGKPRLDFDGDPDVAFGPDPRGLDCSGLIMLGWKVGDVWPFHGEASAATIWASCPRVRWEDRLPGDVVAFGDDPTHAHHVVGVLSADELIGANHGFPPATGETEDAYRARIAAAGAKVVITPADYWTSKRLGVVRAPALL